jgi:hypothetical protein
MSGDTILFLGLRVLHVVLAGIWLGAAFFVSMFLMPVVSEPGPAGGQILTGVVRRGIVPFMASIGGTTVLTGFYLFWRFTGGFDPVVSASRGGMAFSIGALTGFIALILGGSMIGRSAKKISALTAKSTGLSDGAERAALMSEMAALKTRMTTFSRIVVVLLLISMATMALGHYI